MAEVICNLEPLKTLHESRSDVHFIEAFVIEIPAKLSSKALSIVKPVAPNNRNVSFHHLRRIVNLTHLPIDLVWRRDYDSNGLQTVFLLLPNTTVSWETICEALKPHIEEPGLPRCFNCVVPRFAPLTVEQADLWSERYWPCVFNPASQVIQDAPPLHQLRRVQAELEKPACYSYIKLAMAAAQEAKNRGIGRAVGAVVVDPTTQEIIAIAGDGRWWSNNDSTSKEALTSGEGRPEHHALMRVIAMVANRELRRRITLGLPSKFKDTSKENPAGQPLTDAETIHFQPSGTNVEDSMTNPRPSSRASSSSSRQSQSKSEGYLCSGLDLYLTHEPCVCCAMAMIHSRFRACIFQQKMPGSGALVAKTGHNSLGYGLFWRRELNWRVMTFQCVPNEGQKHLESSEKFHA